MARKIRIEDTGYHHIINRGVNRQVIFDTLKDKDKFLEIVCEVALHYDFKIHSYVLMSNHYHLLIENQRENLSHGMRRINASYAMYYNKKYKRTGHLWQDRFKSWYLFDENYLFTLFKYFEFNPISANISSKVGEYPYTLLYDIVKGSVRECMRDSFILKWYDDTSELLKSLDIYMTEEELKKIELFQKQANSYKTKPNKIKHNLKLNEYFTKDMSKIERNEMIFKAFQDGFMQSEIARYLNLSDAGISKILKKLKVKS